MVMKTDRAVIALARGKLSLEQIATKLKLKPFTVIKTGRRLGIYFPPIKHEPTSQRKKKRA